ncbi:hypothetical protein TcasGA2_TC000777 [Tribolium castaneum]|uniref:Uncharacterized protein n=1 Tax=Tribolium castaneum TaxID=7070 RepID=D6WD35_TRICA|nr:hypothetical protein TcasGA2_TC000777 [Tribolium castaneum]
MWNNLAIEWEKRKNLVNVITRASLSGTAKLKLVVNLPRAVFYGSIRKCSWLLSINPCAYAPVSSRQTEEEVRICVYAVSAACVCHVCVRPPSSQSGLIRYVFRSNSSALYLVIPGL